MPPNRACKRLIRSSRTRTCAGLGASKRLRMTLFGILLVNLNGTHPTRGYIMKTRLTFLMLAGMLPGLAAADSLGLWVGAGQWDREVTGYVRDTNDPADNFNLDNAAQGVAMADKREGYLYAVIEHPVPMLPNVKVVSTSQSHSGSGTYNRTFGGISFSEDVEATLDLDHTDITVYWQVLDNVVELDLGLTARKYDGRVRVVGKTSGNVGEEAIDETLPLGYARVGFDLPLTGLSLAVEGNLISVGDSSASDITAKVMYETSFGLGVEGGVRKQTIELDRADTGTVASDIEFNGLFAGVFFHF